MITTVFNIVFLLITFTVGEKDTVRTGQEDNNSSAKLSYLIVDTGQEKCFNNKRAIQIPTQEDPFYGQDAQYKGNQPSYTDNGDGTITDNVTGLMWQKGFVKSEFDDAQEKAKKATTGGHTDWRIPTIKELYSLILFTGNQGKADPSSSIAPNDAVPFIDTDYFEFEYPSVGRYIDAQYLTTTEYVGIVMNREKAFFGVNFADGRIKGYPQSGGRKMNHNLSGQYRPQSNNQQRKREPQDDGGRWYFRLVRGNSAYGQNDFSDNNDGTITDNATGLMWLKDDSGSEKFENLLADFTNDDGSLNWEEALEFAKNLEYAGYSDWRLPNAKELHSIVDYSRAPDVTNSAAIDPVFNSSEITNEAGDKDYPFYWTSTTFEPGMSAIIFQFGRSLGYMNGKFMDVHGAGGQRTDSKIGEGSYGNGPQGDVRRCYNYVRLVRIVKEI